MELPKIKKADKDYGKNSDGNGKSILVEFVSANPTGPLTVGHGRGAIIGDVVSNIYSFNGYKVEREYYYNNAGRQMRKLGESVYSRYLDLNNIKNTFPEDGYKGDYIKDIAEKLEYKERFVMLDHDDLYSNLLKSNISSDKFSYYVNNLIEFCKSNNIILLRTVGVIFSDENKNVSDYVR